MFKLRIERDSYTLKSTQGKLFLNDEFFCYTLEDVSRGENIKIHGHTCIPTGIYKVSVTPSTRFKRDMPMIYTENNGFEIINKGISFKGVRLHGGNSHLDTHGCPLVAYERVNADHIYKSAEKDLTEKLIELGSQGELIVINKKQE